MVPLLTGCQATSTTTQGAVSRSAPQPPRMVQAAAPGQNSRTVTAAEASQVVFPPHTEADVRFMQDMIHHHAQALELAHMVPSRTTSEDIRLLSHRILVSQDSEVAVMTRWLRERGAEIPAIPGVTTPAEHGGHGGHGSEHHPATTQDHGAHSGMPGMLSPAQMEHLASLTGEAFDRVFLEYMIYHHEGALIMVDGLFASPGAGQAGDVFDFASHVDSDQRIEIGRMTRMLEMLEG